MSIAYTGAPKFWALRLEWETFLSSFILITCFPCTTERSYLCLFYVLFCVLVHIALISLLSEHIPSVTRNGRQKKSLIYCFFFITIWFCSLLSYCVSFRSKTEMSFMGIYNLTSIFFFHHGYIFVVVLIIFVFDNKFYNFCYKKKIAA